MIIKGAQSVLRSARPPVLLNIEGAAERLAEVGTVSWASLMHMLTEAGYLNLQMACPDRDCRLWTKLPPGLEKPITLEPITQGTLWFVHGTYVSLFGEWSDRYHEARAEAILHEPRLESTHQPPDPTMEAKDTDFSFTMKDVQRLLRVHKWPRS
jgi:hypothetical protein